MQANESYIDGTPVNISGRVPKGHIVVNNKWRNSNIISSLHGLYLMTKLGVNEGDNIYLGLHACRMAAWFYLCNPVRDTSWTEFCGVR